MEKGTVSWNPNALKVAHVLGREGADTKIGYAQSLQFVNAQFTVDTSHLILLLSHFDSSVGVPYRTECFLNELLVPES